MNEPLKTDSLNNFHVALILNLNLQSVHEISLRVSQRSHRRIEYRSFTIPSLNIVNQTYGIQWPASNPSLIVPTIVFGARNTVKKLFQRWERVDCLRLIRRPRFNAPQTADYEYHRQSITLTADVQRRLNEHSKRPNPPNPRQSLFLWQCLLRSDHYHSGNKFAILFLWSHLRQTNKPTDEQRRRRHSFPAGRSKESTGRWSVRYSGIRTSVWLRWGPKSGCFRIDSRLLLLSMRPAIFRPVLLGQAPEVWVRGREAVRLQDMLPAFHSAGHHEGAPEADGPPSGALFPRTVHQVVATAAGSTPWRHARTLKRGLSTRGRIDRSINSLLVVSHFSSRKPMTPKLAGENRVAMPSMSRVSRFHVSASTHIFAWFPYLNSTCLWNQQCGILNFNHLTILRAIGGGVSFVGSGNWKERVFFLVSTSKVDPRSSLRGRWM